MGIKVMGRSLKSRAFLFLSHRRNFSLSHSQLTLLETSLNP
jgi:hypothetical protein